MKKTLLSSLGLTGLLASLSCFGETATQQNARGFLEEASLSILLRNFYMQNDYRGHRHPRDTSYRQEWAQGFIGEFSSGFTQGTVGFGLDAHAFLGLKLDGGRGHAGTQLLPLDSDGRAERDYSNMSGAVKARISKTVLKYGEMSINTPVMATQDKRLQPERATGFYLTSDEWDDIRLSAGHFTAFKNQNQSSSRDDLYGYGADTRVGSLSFAGIDATLAGTVNTSLYASELSDTWRQYYLGVNGEHAFNADQRLGMDFSLYRTNDYGSRKAGKIDNTAFSLSARYSWRNHAVTAAMQRVIGDTPFDFIGGDSIYLANSVKFADFNGPGERSYQLRYDLDFAPYGVPGLTFLVRYVSGKHIDGTKAERGGAYHSFDQDAGRFVPMYGKGGKHWERDMDLRYTVQSGPAKDLLIHLSHLSHRSNAEQGDFSFDRISLVFEYPWSIF